MSCYIHNIPGRLRVKITPAKGNTQLIEQIREMVNSVKGVQSTSGNSTTGSITILYDSNVVDSSQLLDLFINKGYLTDTQLISHNEYVYNLASRAGQSISKMIFNFFIGKALENAGLSFLAVLI